MTLNKHCYLNNIWDKVFKNGPSKICGRQPLKKFEGVLPALGCLPQFLIGPFLNILSHMKVKSLKVIQNSYVAMVNVKTVSTTMTQLTY